MRTTLGIILILLACVPVASRGGEPVPLLTDFTARNQLEPGDKANILRMDIDVTGDGQAELLLAKALRHAQRWDVYSWTGGTTLRRLGEVVFPYWQFLLTKDPVRLLAPLAIDDTTNGIATYQIGASGIVRLSLEDAAKPGLPTSEDFAAWRKSTNLRVLGAALDDLEGTATPTWTDQLDPQHRRVDGVGGLLNLVVEAP